MLTAYRYENKTGSKIRIADINLLILEDGNGGSIEISLNKKNRGFCIRGTCPPVDERGKQDAGLIVAPLSTNQIEITHTLVRSKHSR